MYLREPYGRPKPMRVRTDPNGDEFPAVRWGGKFTAMPERQKQIKQIERVSYPAHPFSPLGISCGWVRLPGRPFALAQVTLHKDRLVRESSVFNRGPGVAEIVGRFLGFGNPHRSWPFLYSWSQAQLPFAGIRVIPSFFLEVNRSSPDCSKHRHHRG